MTLALRFSTYEDILALPEHVTGQIVNGQLYALPRPALAHAGVASAIGEELGRPFKRGKGGPGGWIILDEPELHLNGNILVPDLAGWRRERLPALPDGPYLELAPDWVCEVLSPSTASLDRGAKLKAYALERVPHCWLVDPIAKMLEVLVLDGPTYRLTEAFSGDAPIRPVPFDAVEFDIGALWLR